MAVLGRIGAGASRSQGNFAPKPLTSAINGTEIIFGTPGIYTWVVPVGVTSVSVVTVGAGGGGTIPGGNSSFGTLCVAGGGGRGYGGVVITGDGGGAGGQSTLAGGGGAGGYTGNGGGGATYNVNTAPGNVPGTGGGVGLYGLGTRGTGIATGKPGKGGAGGGGGMLPIGEVNTGIPGSMDLGGTAYGAGGYGTDTGGGALAYTNTIAVTPGSTFTVTVGEPGGNDAQGGAVRIVWPGDKRMFPATNVGPMANYAVISNVSTVNEDSLVTFTLTTTNVSAGTIVPYTITGIQAADITGGALIGNFVVSADGTDTTTITLLADKLTEGVETVVFTIDPNGASVKIIINDTSLTQIFTLTSSANAVNEGSAVTFTLATTNVSAGTVIPYTVTGIQAADLSAGSLTGNFVVGTTNTAAFTLATDVTTEGTETMLMTLDGKSTTKSVTVNDTSVTQTLALTSSTNSVNEGSAVTFTLATTGISAGTVIPYTVTGIQAADLSAGSLTGSFVIGTTNTAAFTLATDVTTEGTETMLMTLDGRPITASVTVNDTSMTQVFALSSSATNVNEGSAVTFTLTTTNVSAGTVIPYTITGIQAADLSSGTLTGSFVVGTTNTAAVTLARDLTTEDTETMLMTLNGKLITASVTVNDTSMTPVYTLAPTTSIVDQYYDSVSLLMPMDGQNGSTAIVDVKGHVVSNTGVVLSTAQAKSGLSSAYFNKNTLTIPSTAPNFDIGTGDFTVEFWMYNIPTGTGYASIFNMGGVSIQFGDGGFSNRLMFSVNAGIDGTWRTGQDLSSTANRWIHVALTRQSGIGRMFIDGSLQTVSTLAGTFTTTTTPSIPNAVTAGGSVIIGSVTYSPGNATGFSGYIDDLRVTNGIARYTVGFTPATALGLLDKVVVASSVNEGSTAYFTISSSEPLTGAVVAYTLSGVTAADITRVGTNATQTVGNPLSGNVTINGKYATASFDIAADFLTEGNEVLTMAIDSLGLAANVTIIDTTLTQTFALVSDTASVNEGSPVTFTLTTTNVPDNTLVPYAITGINAADLSSGSVTGNFTVMANTATTSVTLANDFLTEGTETMLMTTTLNGKSATSSVTVNDTSLTQTFALTSSTNSVNEGSPVTFTLATTNVPDNTLVPYAITGINAADLSSGSVTGNFTVMANTATTSVTLANDVTTEGTETMLMTTTLNGKSATSSVTVNDTSLTQVFTLASDVANVNEGSAVTFTLTTTNVSAGTVIPYTVTGINAADLSSGSLTGSFVVGTTNTAAFTLANDLTSEGAETMLMTLDGKSTTKSVTVNDTSLTPITYTLSSSASTINEGSAVTFTLATTNVSAGTVVPYTITGITAADLSAGSLTGSFVVGTTNTAAFTLASDLSTEGTETMLMTLDGKSSTAAVTINDTSLTQIFTLDSDTVNVNEGSAVTFTLTTTNVSAGTVVPYTVTGIQAADLSSGTLTGSFVIGTTNTAAFTLASDLSTEGTETMLMTLDGKATTKSVTVNDTSLNPYSLTSSAEVIDEGNSVTFTLATIGISAGTIVTYTVTGIQAADLSSGSMTGSFVVGTTNTATFTLAIDSVADNETMTVSLDGLGVAKSITVVNASPPAIIQGAATASTLDKYVSLLLNADGVNAATNNTFVDGSSNNFAITRTGNTTQGSFSPYSNSGFSGSFNGAGDFFTIPNSQLFNLNTDFTIDAWVNVPSFTVSGQIIGVHRNGYNADWVLAVTSTGNLQFVWNNSLSFTSTSSIKLNVWSHIAVTRSGSTATIYIDGVAVGSATVSSINFVTGSPIGIGSDYQGLSPFKGYMSGLRVVKGTAVYTSAFTPSTAPLTAIAGTSLLTLQDNRFKDNSANNLTLTRAGTPSIQAFSPYATTAYVPAVNGGSMYFDGTGDYLSTPASANFNVGTGNFTIELWAYLPTTSTGTRALWTNGPAAVGSFGMYVTSSNIIEFAQYGSSNLNSTIALTLGAWNHVAVVRSGTALSVYINGVAAGSTTSSFNNTSNAITVGAVWGSLAIGHIADLRFSKTVVYTAAFVPPTAPVTAITGTQLLLSGTNSGIFDATGKNDLETVGTAQISTTVKKFGTGSMVFNGTGSLYLPSSTNFGYGTGDFTIEMWIYLNATTAATIMSNLATPTSTAPHIYYDATANAVKYYHTSADRIIGGALSINTWHHIAVCRASGSTKMFVNGAQVGNTYADTTNYGTSNPLGVGNSATTGGAILNGYIDDFRITKAAMYTTAFTPPVALSIPSIASPAYSYTFKAAASILEGNVLTFTLDTTGISNGTVVPYTISGITAADLSSGSLTGNFTVNANAAVVTVTLLDDSTIENETLILEVTAAGQTRLLNVLVVDSATIATKTFTNTSTTDNYSSLMLTTSGVNTATNNTFVDSSSNNFAITRAGNTTQGSFSPYSNSGFSGYFNGTSGLNNTASGTALQFASSDAFTIETWVYLTAVSNNADSGAWLLSTTQSAGGMQLGIKPNTSTPYITLSNTAQWTGLPALVGSPMGLNQWVHIAIVRDAAGITTMYQNGIVTATSTNLNVAVTATGCWIGTPSTAPGNAAYSINGYLNNLRVVKSAVYTAAFTPSTAPLTAIAGTSLLTLQDNRFKDNSANNLTLTYVGAPSIQAFSPYTPTAYVPAVNGGSMYFDGSGDFLTTPYNSQLLLNGSDSTIECWVYMTRAPGASNDGMTPSIAVQGNGSYKQNGTDHNWMAIISTNSIIIGAAPTLTTATYNVPLNTWVHIAYTMTAANVGTIYVNGVQVVQQTGRTALGSNATYATKIGTGQYGDNPINNWFPGYIADFRVTKGTAVYTTAFTPSTAPLTAITGTQLLLSGTNAGIYDTTGKLDVETVGTAQVSTTVTKFGTGSMKFDGSSYLTIVSNPNNFLGTGDYTVETWVYPTSVKIGENLVCVYDTTGGASFGYNQTQIYVGARGVAYDLQVTYSLAVNTWTHLAWVRASGVVTIFANGALIGSGAVTRSSPQSQIGIGDYPSLSGNGVIGNIEDFRITKGLARYTAAFTPPTVKLTPNASSYTLTTTVNPVTEGNAVTYTLSTNGVAAGTVVPYTVIGITADDLSAGTLTGNFVVGTTNTAAFTLVGSDSAENETMVLTLDGLGVTKVVLIKDQQL